MAAKPFYAMMGPPASGKGTQGRLLAHHLGVSYLSTGATLRQAIQEGSPLGQEAQRFLERNDYIPDRLANELVNPWLHEQKRGWVLDGFPRTLPQAISLVDGFGDRFQAFHLDVPEVVLRQRVIARRECLPCGRVAREGESVCPQCDKEWTMRQDDSLEALTERLQAYRSFTLPVLEFFQARGQLQLVDGRGNREEVWRRIEERL